MSHVACRMSHDVASRLSRVDVVSLGISCGIPAWEQHMAQSVDSPELPPPLPLVCYYFISRIHWLNDGSKLALTDAGKCICRHDFHGCAILLPHTTNRPAETATTNVAHDQSVIPPSTTSRKLGCSPPCGPMSVRIESDSTECLFFSNIDHGMDICKSCAVTMSENIRRCYHPFEAVGSFQQRNRSRPAAAQRDRFSATFVALLWARTCASRRNEDFRCRNTTSDVSRWPTGDNRFRVSPLPVSEFAREGNSQQLVAMALVRAGLTTSAAEQLAQRLINDDGIAA